MVVSLSQFSTAEFRMNVTIETLWKQGKNKSDISRIAGGSSLICYEPIQAEKIYIKQLRCVI